MYLKRLSAARILSGEENMAEYPLVSIITPCYNGEKFIDRYFNAILKQTYPNIELFFVNDGSTDRTEEIALSYKEKFEEKGYQFNYIDKENGGQASAINRALPLFTGKYLTWPDSDDWITPDAIERRVKFLEEHPSLGLVQSRSAEVSEDDLNKVLKIQARRDTANGWIFDGMVFEIDTPIACGSILVNSEKLLEVIPGRHIYESDGGQNWQLLLPLCYKYECGFLPEILYYIVVRRDSHSHSDQDYESKIIKSNHHEDILYHVLSDIDMPEEKRQDYFHRIRIKYIRRHLQYAAEHHKRNEAKKFYAELVKEGAAERRDRLNYARAMFIPIDYGFRAAKFCKAKLRGAVRAVRKKQ